MMKHQYNPSDSRRSDGSRGGNKAIRVDLVRQNESPRYKANNYRKLNTKQPRFFKDSGSQGASPQFKMNK